MGDQAQRDPDTGTENGIEGNTPIPGAEGDLFIDRIGHINRIGIELPPSKKMRDAVWCHVPFLVLNTAGNRLHQLRGRRKSFRLAGAGTGSEHGSIRPDKNRSLMACRIESTEKILEVFDPDFLASPSE